MRGMDGYEVLDLLLHTAKTHEIPFIFSTSMAEKIDRTAALKLGADDYIVKPFESETLLQMAKACIKAGSKRPAMSTTGFSLIGTNTFPTHQMQNVYAK